MTVSADEMIEAAVFGDLPALRTLLADGADPNAAGTHGLTPLCGAAAGTEHRLAVVEVLLAQGADPAATTEEGRTALFYAHSEEVARRLLEAGAEIRLRDRTQKTALFPASENLRTDVVQCLLGHGVDPNAVDEAGDTAMHVALRSPVLERALPRRPRPGLFVSPNFRPYVEALTQLSETVAALLDAGASPDVVNAGGEVPLSLAVHAACTMPYAGEETWIEIVTALVEAGASPDISIPAKVSPLASAKNAVVRQIQELLDAAG